MRDPLAEALRPGSRLPTTTRVVTSTSPLTIDVTGNAVPAVDATGGRLILPGDLVLVTEGDVRRVLAVLASRPARGVVSSVAAPYATVNVGGLLVQLAYIGSAPTVGATVGIMWDVAGSYIVGTLSTATATNPGTAAILPTAPTTVQASLKSYDLIARAIAVSTASGTSWTSWGDYATTAVQGTYSGSNYKSGFYLYGSQFGGRAGRTCLAAKVELKRGPAGLGASGIPGHLRLHTSPTKGSSAPTLTTDAEQVTAAFAFGERKVVTLPTAWGQKLLDGTAAGIALVYSGTTDYAQWTGLDTYAASGQITLTVQEA